MNSSSTIKKTQESREFWDNGSLPLQYNPIYDSAPLVVPYKVGQMFYHTGHVLHQIVPGYDLQPDDRGLLQGHGIKCDGDMETVLLDFNRIKILARRQERGLRNS